MLQLSSDRNSGGGAREAMQPSTVLFLAANPVRVRGLQLDEECRAIKSKIQAAKFRDQIRFRSWWAARPDDLLQALNEISFRPGTDPVGALARHVLVATQKVDVQAFRAELLETPTLLAARLAEIGHVNGSHVLLAVDQLEEVFTQGASEAERQRFLQMLLAAADDPLDPVRVVVTVRDDFVGKLAGLRSLFVVNKLGLNDVRRTITGPLARYNFQFDGWSTASRSRSRPLWLSSGPP